MSKRFTQLKKELIRDIFIELLENQTIHKVTVYSSMVILSTISCSANLLDRAYDQLLTLFANCKFYPYTLARLCFFGLLQEDIVKYRKAVKKSKNFKCSGGTK